MPDNYTLIGIVLFAAIFILSGIHSIIRREITFNYRKGTVRPVFAGRLRGSCAVIYGIFSIVSGISMVIPLIYVFFFHKSIGDSIITLVSVVGIAIFIIGLTLSSIMQILLNWGASLKASAKEAKALKNSPK